ncbi:MAG: hypothetical protein IKA74_04420 [Clostridia bacterium]|nr:hypothetical protein [Clostridia bacterium]
MGYRSIIVSSPAKITVKNEQLVIIVTEKQYESIRILVGELHSEEKPSALEQLSIF